MLAMYIKHLSADFILQSNWMARGKNRMEGWLVPLAAHAGLHGLGTLAIALTVKPELWWLGPIDALIHGGVDRGKAFVSQRWNFPTTDVRFWWIIGFDQFAHHITDLGLVAAMLII